MNYTKEIFDMLGVTPEEEFRLMRTIHKSPYTGIIYKIDSDLILSYKMNGEDSWEKSELNIGDILSGRYVITKLILPTEDDIIAIKYAKACGCKYITKDANGDIHAYLEKPTKISEYGYWLTDRVEIKINIPISFISWEDDEPYYINE